MRLRESGAIAFVLVAVVALAFLGFCLYALSGAMSSIVDPVQPGVPAASTSDAPFIPAWSIRLSPPLVHEMALSPGRLGHFLALDDDEILQFDSSGARFRAIQTRDGVYGISLRQVFGRGPGVRQALAFFDGEGAVIREVELPADAGLLTYAPIGAMDVDGSGRRNWVVGLGDGTILVYSPLGEQLARHRAGSRLKTLLAVPQPDGPDLLMTATRWPERLAPGCRPDSAATLSSA